VLLRRRLNMSLQCPLCRILQLLEENAPTRTFNKYPGQLFLSSEAVEALFHIVNVQARGFLKSLLCAPDALQRQSCPQATLHAPAACIGVPVWSWPAATVRHARLCLVHAAHQGYMHACDACMHCCALCCGQVPLAVLIASSHAHAEVPRCARCCARPPGKLLILS
jgi:hypothetical protein